jgi:AcrR family transcriptional regulator
MAISHIAKVEKNRLGAADWENAALDVIADYGVAAVAVEPLARTLNVTKGSFYWHFATREALLAGALKRWSEDDRGDVMRHVGGILDPRQRLIALFRVTSRTMRTHRIYSALLKAVDLPVVAEVMERTSEARIVFLTELFAQLGLDTNAAAHRARLAYSAYVGFLQLSLQVHMPRLSHADFDDYVAHVTTTLVP